MPDRELAFYLDPSRPDLAEHLEFLNSRGVTAVGTDGFGGHDAAQGRAVGGALREAGMRVVSAHGTSAMAHPTGDPTQLHDAHRVTLDYAAAWGAEHVVLHFRTLQIPWREGLGWAEADHIAQVGLEAYDAQVVEFLEWLCGEAAERNVGIALENLPIQHQFSYRVEEIAAMIDGVGADYLGICLDAGHVHCSGLDLAEAILSCGSRLATLHLHDNFGGGDPRLTIHATDRHLVPGLGTIDWRAAIRALDGVDYDGPAVFEGVRMPPSYEAESQPAIDLTITNWRAFEALAEADGE